MRILSTIDFLQNKRIPSRKSTGTAPEKQWDDVPSADSCLFRGTTEEQTTPPGSPILFEGFFIINPFVDMKILPEVVFSQNKQPPSLPEEHRDGVLRK
jgi:hypothetical protein